MAPVFILDKCQRIGTVWVAWFDCTCGRRHMHGLGDGDQPWSGGDRAAHCIPVQASVDRCPCGKWRTVHPGHARAATRNRETGYTIVRTPDTEVIP